RRRCLGQRLEPSTIPEDVLVGQRGRHFDLPGRGSGYAPVGRGRGPEDRQEILSASANCDLRESPSNSRRGGAPMAQSLRGISGGVSAEQGGHEGSGASPP